MVVRGGVAVVTGGASGIGLKLAAAASERHDHVVIGDVDDVALVDAVAELAAAGASVHAVPVDVSDRTSVQALARAAFALGPVRMVCMNAGVASSGVPTWELRPEQLEFVVGVNFMGLAHSVACFVPGLIGQGGPSGIVVTASMGGLVALPNGGGYAASKAAVIAYTKALAGELAVVAPDVSVALLCPSVVATNLMRTSAIRSGAVVQEAELDAAHNAVQELGVAPEEVATSVMSAVEARRFWVLPPPDDVFTGMLIAEFDEIRASLR